MKKIAIIIACGLLLTNLAIAQTKKTTTKTTTAGNEEVGGNTGESNTSHKFGWLNSSELLRLIPETIKADSDIAKYQKSFQEQIEQMAKEGQEKYKSFQAHEKEMDDAKKEVAQRELQDIENRIQSFQQAAQEKIQAKKSELLQPILEKADKAIKAVAKEKKYDYVFEASQGNILYATEGDNIMPYVKAKLGIK